MNKKLIIIITVAIVVIVAIVAIILITTNKKYTVRFDAQGGSNIPEIEIKAKKNETIVLPKYPKKEGYQFMYWEDEDHNRVSSNFTVKKDTVLTAKWWELGTGVSCAEEITEVSSGLFTH